VALKRHESRDDTSTVESRFSARATATRFGEECAACGGRGTKHWASIDAWAYVSCKVCGLVRLDLMPSPADAAALYDDDYFTGSAHRGYADYVADERVHRNNARRHLRRVADLGATRGRLLEIGAAAGFLLDEARRDGWRVAGVEVAPSMRACAHGRYGIDLATSIGELDRDERFDVAIANQVLEHTVDPLGLLQDIRTRLAPGGLVSIETWDRGAAIARAFGRRWQQVNPPSVLWLWDARQLGWLVERAGFTVEYSRPAMKYVSAATVSGQLGRSSRFGKLAVPYALGDLRVLVARARANPATTRTPAARQHREAA
jgi:SAM-dependent methyltransferase